LYSFHDTVERGKKMKMRAAPKLVLLVLVFLTISCSFGLPKLSAVDRITDLLPGGERPMNGEKPAAEEPAQVWVRQWAASAKASSEYGNPDWAASQATGAPDTPDCGDYETAWASEGKFSVDWLEVAFETKMYPTEINIYESHTPTQIVKVEILDDQGIYHEVYAATPQGTSCPYILKVSIQDAVYQAVGVKITVDQSHLDLPWDEIDAVELVGYIQSDTAPQITSEDAVDSPESQPDPEDNIQDANDWSWTSYTSADGLPDDNVQAIAIETNGTMWIGMKEGGVSRFTNGKFTNFTVDDGLGSNNVKALVITSDGSVWAGTASGLSLFDGNEWKTYKKDDGLVSNIINAIAITSEEAMWIATETGISYYDQTSWTNYSPEDGLGRTNVHGVAIAADGDVWFASFDGVTRYDGNSWDYFNIEDGLSMDVFTSVGADPDGSMWLGTPGEAADRFENGQFVSFKSEMGPTVYVRAIAAGLDGVMWFATEGDGVYRYDGRDWTQYLTNNSGITYNWVDAVAVAPDGALWFAARKNGIVRYGP
jgi:ligand-binding sensor domain-containing protein